MEENKELEQKKEHGFKFGVLTGVLGTAAVVLAAGAVLFAHGNLKVSETAGTSQTAQTVLDDGTLPKLDELMGQINLNYYEDVDASDLQEGLYSGLLEGLNDPYSAYYTEEEYKDLMEQTQGNFYGIGAGLSQDKESMQVTITKVYEDTPAEKAGLKAGDVIIPQAYSPDDGTFYFELPDGTAGNLLVDLSPDGSEGQMTYSGTIGGVDENELFENLPYAG